MLIELPDFSKRAPVVLYTYRIDVFLNDDSESPHMAQS